MSQILIRAAVREGLKQAFGGSSFDISGVSNVCKALNIPRYVDNDPDWTGLQAAHCLSWKVLQPDELQEVLKVAFRVMKLKPSDYTDVNPLARLEAATVRR